jgi:hypothetical protein
MFAALLRFGGSPRREHAGKRSAVVAENRGGGERRSPSSDTPSISGREGNGKR